MASLSHNRSHSSRSECVKAKLTNEKRKSRNSNCVIETPNAGVQWLCLWDPGMGKSSDWSLQFFVQIFMTEVAVMTMVFLDWVWLCTTSYTSILSHKNLLWYSPLRFVEVLPLENSTLGPKGVTYINRSHTWAVFQFLEVLTTLHIIQVGKTIVPPLSATSLMWGERHPGCHYRSQTTSKS